MTAKIPTPEPNHEACGADSAAPESMAGATSARGNGCRRRWPWITAVFVLLIILALFAPRIASYEPFRGWILHRAVPGIRGTISCADASFGWFSPVVIEGLRINSPQAGADKASDDAQPVITVEKIAGDRPLWRLLCNRSAPGDFLIEKPTLNIVVSAAGSNLEGVFAPGARQTAGQREALQALNMGLHIRAAELSLSGPRIPQGWRTQPLDVDMKIDGGVLELAPLVLFDHARITPRACHDFLRFVAPILADATTVDGEFSLKLDAWRVPLCEPQNTTGSGTLDIYALNVQAGPLVTELTRLLGLSQRILVVKDSPVSFYMEDGRIHHLNLAFYVEGVEMRTHGSVGLDEALQLTVDVPMPKKLLGDGPLAVALSRQTLHIPIGGTLSQPRVDAARLGRSVESLVRGTVRSMAATDVAKAEGLLEGLFRRKSASPSTSDNQPAANAAGFLRDLLRRSTTTAPSPDDQPTGQSDTPSDGTTTDAEAVINEIIGAAGNLLEKRRQLREQGEPTLLDRLRQRRRPRDNAPADAAANAPDGDDPRDARQ